jgi:transposase
MPRTSPFIITLSSSEERILVEYSRKYTASYAKVVLFAAAGMANVQISELVDLPLRIVTKWRKRFYYERLDGLEDQPRCGRPRSFSPSEHCGD